MARRGPRWGRCLLFAMAAGAFGVVGAVPVAAAPADEPTPVPTPVLTEPPAGLKGHPLWDSYFDLAPFGYEDQELFVSGTARDETGRVAPYTTRIIVTRPTDPDRFNGVVVLDWVNVSGQLEIAVDSTLARPMLLREGFAVVHVSAQQAGLCCLPGLTPKTWDPVRYAALSHPGDAWAFDIFTQVAQAFRRPPPAGGLDPMGGLGVGRVQHVLAAGQSQSGIRLHDYVDRWLPAHPAAGGLIDGFLIHGDVAQPKRFRQAVPVPVLKLESDFEAVADGVDPATLDPNVRLWEVAGTGHSDLFIGYQSTYGHGPRSTMGAPRLGRAAYEELLWAAGQYGEQPTPLHATCILAGATMPMRYAAGAALHHLGRWVAGGPPPSHGPRFHFAGGLLARDADGNAKGGIRLPPIDVPVATYASTVCGLGGITIPFTDLQLVQRYGSHAAYVARMALRTDAAVAAGWLLPDDARDLMARACAARNRFPPSHEPCPAYEPPPFFQPAVPAGTATVPTTGDDEAGADRAAGTSTTTTSARSGVDRLPATGGRAGPGPLVVLALVGAALVLRGATRSGSRDRPATGGR